MEDHPLRQLLFLSTIYTCCLQLDQQPSLLPALLLTGGPRCGDVAPNKDPQG